MVGILVFPSYSVRNVRTIKREKDCRLYVRVREGGRARRGRSLGRYPWTFFQTVLRLKFETVSKMTEPEKSQILSLSTRLSQEGGVPHIKINKYVAQVYILILY